MAYGKLLSAMFHKNLMLPGHGPMSASQTGREPQDSLLRAVVEEIVVLAALSLFVGMISVWALAIVESW